MTQQIWAAVNKDGFIMLFTGEPVRDDESGKWIGKYPYINSNVYPQFCDLIKKSKMSWKSEPEMFEIQM